jgi:hypothetical protein
MELKVDFNPSEFIGIEDNVRVGFIKDALFANSAIKVSSSSIPSELLCSKANIGFDRSSDW